MKRLLSLTLALTFIPIVIAQPAFAHVLITDEAHKNGIILHITPDDDPVAGQSATLFFEVQNDVLARGTTASFSVKDAQGDVRNVKPSISGSLVTIDYVFATQGVYDLTLTISKGTRHDIFTYVQRVSRGTSTGALDQPSYAWADIILTVSLLSFAVLAIVIINRRKEIAEYSTF